MDRCDFFDEEDGCGLDVVEGIPTEEDCSSCMKYQGPARGLGDRVHRIISSTGLDRVVGGIADGDCGCAKRRASLNRLFPSKD